MTVKLVIYIWELATLVALILLFIYLPVVSIIKFINGDKFSTRRSYSYVKTVKFSIIASIIFLLISILIYLETQSKELSITFFVFFESCTLAGLIKNLNMESHLKNRGAKKDDP